MTSKPPTAFALHTLLDGCVAEVSLNDVPLAGADLRRMQASVHATPWIVDGVNELRIDVTGMRSLEILPMGAVARDDDAGPVGAWARLLGGHYEDLVPDEQRDSHLAELRWGPVDDDARNLPRSLGASFTVAGRPRWAWQDAPQLAMDDPRVRARVLDFLRELHAAFRAGDGPGVVARMGSLVRESAHFGPGGSDFARGFAGELSRIASEPGFAMDDFSDEHVVLRPIAGGRVLRVLHVEGGSLLRSAPSMEEPFRFRLDLAELGGELEIVRTG